MALIKERVPNFLIGLFIGTVLAVLFFYARSRLATEWEKYPPNETHKVMALQGEWFDLPRPITAEDLKGRAMAVLFISSKCDGCAGLVNLILQIETEFKEKVLTALVAGTNPNKGFAQLGIQKKSFDYYISDRVGNIVKKLGVRRMPAMIFVSPNGQVATTIYSVNDAIGFMPNLRLILNQYSSNIKTAEIK